MPVVDLPVTHTLRLFFAEHVNEPAVASGDTAEPVNKPANAPGNTAEAVNGPAATPGNTAEPVNEPAAAPGNTAEPVNEPANAPGIGKNTAELGLGHAQSVENAQDGQR